MKQILVFCCACICCAWPCATQSLYPVYRNGKWGFMDAKGALQVDFRFDRASSGADGVAKARLGPDLYLFYKDGRETRVPNAVFFEYLEPNVFRLQRAGKWWLCDSNANIIFDRECDRIRPVKEIRGLYYFYCKEGTGVVNRNGIQLLVPGYDKVKAFTENYYSVNLNKTLFILINGEGEKVIDDSFLRVQLIEPGRDFFAAKNYKGETVIFSGKGEVLWKEKGLNWLNLGNAFLRIQIHKKTYLFDMTNGKKMDSLGSNFNGSPIPNSVLVLDKKMQKLFLRDRGIVLQGTELQIDRDSNLYFVRMGFRYGIWDLDLNMIAPAIYSSASRIGGRYVELGDSGMQKAIFNLNTRKFETEFKYFRFRYAVDHVKAFYGETGMDDLVLDSTGKISEIIAYENVRSIEIKRSNWQTRSDAANRGWVNVVPSQPSIVQQSVSNRMTGWNQVKVGYEKYMYQLSLKQNDTGVARMVLPPIFEGVNVLPSGRLTLAKYGGTNKEGAVPVKGFGLTIPAASYSFVNDSTGKKIGQILQHVRLKEFLDSGEYFSVFADRQAMILNKKSFRPVFKCTYIMPAYKGSYGVYLRGFFAGRRNEAYQIGSMRSSACLQEMGFYSNFRVLDYSLQGGEWQLILPGGRLIKPEIAGTHKILFMEEFQAGYSVVTLDNLKKGVIDSMGNTVVKAEFDHIVREINFPGHFFCGTSVQKYGLVSSSGEILSTPGYQLLENKGEMLRASLHDSTWLLNPVSGESHFLGRRLKTTDFVDGNGFVRYKKGYRMLNTSGEMQEGYFRNVIRFHNGFAPVQVHGRWGLLDESGTLVMDPRYSGAREFGYTSGVFKSQKWKFFTPGGDRVKGPKAAEAVTELSPGVFVYKNNAGHYGMFDEEGKKISGFRFVEKPILYNGFILGTKRSSVYFYSERGQKQGRLPGQAGHFNRQILEETGRIITRRNDPENCFLLFSAAQMRAFGQDSPWHATEVMLPLKSVSSFLQKKYLMEAYLNDVYMSGTRNPILVNGNGEKIIEEVFLKAEPMRHGRAICTLWNGRTGLLEYTGFWLIPPVYHDLKRMNDSVFAYKVAFDFQIMNTGGKTVFSGPVDHYSINAGVVQVGYRNKVGYCNMKGELLWELSE